MEIIFVDLLWHAVHVFLNAPVDRSDPGTGNCFLALVIRTVEEAGKYVLDPFRFPGIMTVISRK